MKDTNEYFYRMVLGIMSTTVLVLVFFVAFASTNNTKTPTAFVYPQISEEEKYFDKLTEDIIQCESRGLMVWGDLDKPHKAYGVAQFQKRTFDWLCKLSGKTLDYHSAQDQRELLRWAIENDYGYLWTCHRNIRGY